MTWLADVLRALSDMGGLAGLAAVITSLATLRRTENQHAKRRAVDDARWLTVSTELQPNHGSSLRDAVARIEHSVDALREDHTDLSRRLGHEMGDIRRARDREHADISERLRGHDDRIRHLEETRH